MQHADKSKAVAWLVAAGEAKVLTMTGLGWPVGRGVDDTYSILLLVAAGHCEPKPILW